jgi:hypothetical protein
VSHGQDRDEELGKVSECALFDASLLKRSGDLPMMGKACSRTWSLRKAIDIGMHYNYGRRKSSRTVVPRHIQQQGSV